MNKFWPTFVPGFFFVNVLLSFGQPEIISVEPEFGCPGEAINVLILGHGTHFIDGQSIAYFGPDIVVEFSVINEELGRAFIQITATAELGRRPVRITTRDEVVILDDGFEVLQRGANVMVRLEVVPVDVLYLADFDPTKIANAPLLFTITLFNDDFKRNLQFQLNVCGEKYGLIVIANKSLKLIEPNDVITVSNREFDEYNTSGASDEVSSIARETGVLPPDTYTFYLSVFDENGNIIAKDEASITMTNPISELELIGPGVHFGEEPEIIYSGSPLFQWFSQANSFDFALYPVFSGQNSAKDIVENRSVLQEWEITGTSFLYPNYAEVLEAGKIYAWQVKAHITSSEGGQLLSSEVFWFAVGDSGAEMSISTAVSASVVSIEVEPEEIDLLPGETYQFKAVAYSTNDEEISITPAWQVVPSEGGTIDENGLFNAGPKSMTVAIVAEYDEARDYATVFINLKPPKWDLHIVSPSDEQLISEPYPSFVWEDVGADSLPPHYYRVTLWQVPDDHLTPELFSTPALWQRTVQGSMKLDYPPDANALQDGHQYAVQVAALDDAGGILAQSAPVRFIMSRNAKIDWELFQVWSEAKRQGQAGEAISLLVKLRADSLSEVERQLIIAAGARVDIEEGPWLQLTAPFSKLDRLANLDFFGSIALPAPHRLEALPNSILHPAFSGMTDMFSKHKRDNRANGIRVAVFDFGFDISELGDRAMQFFSFRQDRRIEGISQGEALHGTACANIIAELVPNAELFLINFDTELEFLQALRYAVDTHQVRVISCSVSWMQAYDHYDGTSRLWNQVDKILKNRTVLVVAAGNFAQSHWEGHFHDRNADGSHDFGTNNSPLKLYLKSGISYSFLLSWDDWLRPRIDLDLCLLDSAHQHLVSPSGREYRSANRQGKEQYEEPVERITNFLSLYPGSSWYYLDIFLKYSKPVPDPPAYFELYVYPPPEEAVPAPANESSLASGLATSRSQSVIVVSAVALPQCSQGPTNNGRGRPDFAAIGKTHYQDEEFRGSSFATPRVAAALTMIFDKHPSWSAYQAIDLLRGNCTGANKTIKDYVHGWGEIDFEKLRMEINR